MKHKTGIEIHSRKWLLPSQNANWQLHKLHRVHIAPANGQCISFIYSFTWVFVERVRPPRQSAQWHAGRHLCGEPEPEPEQQQQEKLSGTNFPIGELELNEKVTTRTHTQTGRQQQQIGGASERDHEGGNYAVRTRIRCTPGEGWGITSHGHQAEHSNHCVCLRGSLHALLSKTGPCQC